MKIRIRYDNSIAEYEVTEQECEEMIESDYRDRLRRAEHPETITRRPIQVILDERFNRPEYNSYQKMKRHNCSLDSLCSEGDWLLGKESDVSAILERKEVYRKLSDAINPLEPQQRELLYRVIFLGEKEVDIARSEGVSKAAISQRLDRIFRQIEKNIKNL